MTRIEYVTKVQVSNKIQIPKPVREALGGLEHEEKVRVWISKEEDIDGQEQSERVL